MRTSRWIVAAGAVAGALFASKALKRRARTQQLDARQEQEIDTEIDDSFPASDPPSHTPTAGATTAF